MGRESGLLLEVCMTVLGKSLGPILALLCLLLTSAASADATPNAPNTVKTTRARESYARGQQLFRQGDFVGAQTSFEAAYEAVPNPIVLLSIAECQVRSEQFAWAVVSLERYLAERPSAPDRAQVEAQIAKLREKPGYVNVISKPLGAAVIVDGVDSGKTTPVELPLASGDHVLFVELEGYRRGEVPVAVAIGSRQTVEVTLESSSNVDEPVAVAPEPVAPEAPPPARNRTALWVAAGLTGAGVVGGVILGGLALKSKSDFDKNPTESEADRGERLALFSDVGFGIAAAAAVTGLVLYLTEGDEPSEKTAFRVAPSLARSEAGVVGHLSF